MTHNVVQINNLLQQKIMTNSHMKNHTYNSQVPLSKLIKFIQYNVINAYFIRKTIITHTQIKLQDVSLKNWKMCHTSEITFQQSNTFDFITI